MHRVRPNRPRSTWLAQGVREADATRSQHTASEAVPSFVTAVFAAPAAVSPVPSEGPDGTANVVVAALLLVAIALAVVAWRAVRGRRIAERRAMRAGERLTQVSSMTGGLAHEIKNPLSTLVLNAQLLDEELDEAVPDPDARGRLHRRVGALVRETIRLRGILEDFLRYAGRMRLDPQRRDIAALVSDLVDFFHPQCDQAAVLLRAEIPPSRVEAEIDEPHLKQAILNLMLNALQSMDGRAAEGAAPRGELMVRVEAGEDDVRIHVIDTGPGIAPDRVDEIFRPYVSGKPGGSGLGLPTARRIVEEHGGELTVHSERGRGSDFTIRLPRSRGDAIPEAGSAAKPTAG
jgi:signal transduction histidine kinase